MLLVTVLMAGAPAALAGCATTSGAELEGTSWVLQLPEEQAGAGLIPVEVTLTFSTKDSIAGSYGLQKYAGSYRVDGDSLYFGDLCWTTMSCMAAGGTMNAEQEYLFALGDAQRYRAEGDTLVIHYGDQELTFHRA